MHDAELDGLMTSSLDDLSAFADADQDLTSKLHAQFPEASEHVGYTFFDPKWAQTYGRQLLRAIGRLQDVQSWSFAESTANRLTIGAIANDLLHYLGLPASSTFAATALTLLIVRSITEEKAKTDARQR